MDQVTLRTLLLTNSVFAAGIGFLMNITLLFLITKRTPSSMKSYSRIMRIHCFSDILYDSVQFFTGFHPTPIGGCVYCLWQGFITKVPIMTNRLLFSMWFWTLLAAVALLPIDFYFRYKSVCHNKELSSRTIALMVFFAYFITWLHAFPNSLNYMDFGPTKLDRLYTVELEKYDYWKGNVPSFAVTALGNATLFNDSFVVAINVFSYSIIGFTTYKINQAMKTNAKLNKSAKALELQKQVSRILALQFFLPLLVISIPMSFIALMALLKFDFPKAGAYGSAVWYWLSAVKPIATIIIVKSYREYVLRKVFRPIFNSDSEIKSISTTNMNQTIMDSSISTEIF